jgi:IS66 Orf2 like protein
MRFVPAHRQARFCRRRRGGDHQVTFVAYPFAGQQLLEKGFFQPSARPVVHILRRGDRIKLLFWDGQGFCLYYKYKVLERGRFVWPSPADGVAR